MQTRIQTAIYLSTGQGSRHTGHFAATHGALIIELTVILQKTQLWFKGGHDAPSEESTLSPKNHDP